MKTTICTSAVLFCLLFTACQPDTPSPERERATRLVEQADAVMKYDRPDGLSTFWRAAADLLEEAIGADSTYAEAWAAITLPYFMLSGAEGEDWDESNARARAAAARAIELDPASAYSLFADGIVRGAIDGDLAGAEQVFRQAILTDPGLAEAHRELAVVLLKAMRSGEALIEAHRALELDPVSIRAISTLAYGQVYAGRFQEALATVEAGRKLDRNDYELIDAASMAYVGLRDYESALAHAEEAIAELGLSPEQAKTPMAQGVVNLKWVMMLLGRLEEAKALFKATGNLYGVATVDASLGNTQEAAQSIAEMERRMREMGEWGWEWGIGNVYLLLGDRETALDWLERAHATRVEKRMDLDNYIWWLRYHEMYDGIRDDPRIQAILSLYES